MWLEEERGGVSTVAGLDKVLVYLLTFKQMFYYKSKEEGGQIVIMKKG